ncbi:MAG: AraC family transcriptional regulator [Gemmatimonadota bacterium]|nr:AraC family transcriptional regulator [Gemmatimonadota bacterium]
MALPVEDVALVTVIHSGSPFEILRGRFVRQRFSPHLHDTYAIGVMESGAARCRSRGLESTHGSGDLITIDPEQVHTGEPLSAEGWSYRMLYIPCEVMARAVDGAELPRFTNTGTPDLELSARIARVHALLEQGADPLLQEAALLATLHAICTRHAQRTSSAPALASPHAVHRVRDYLDSHFAEPVCLADLALVGEMSAFHLIRQFRRYYGVPPHRYLDLVRVQRAKLMLQKGARISDAAFATGFSDQSHLTRQFKRVLGVTPGSYAKSYGRRNRRSYELSGIANGISV